MWSGWMSESSGRSRKAADWATSFSPDVHMQDPRSVRRVAVAIQAVDVLIVAFHYCQAELLHA